MKLKAGDVQKQKIKEIEAEADKLVRSCGIMFESSVNEKGYPRTFCIGGYHLLNQLTKRTAPKPLLSQIAEELQKYPDQKLKII